MASKNHTLGSQKEKNFNHNNGAGTAGDTTSLQYTDVSTKERGSGREREKERGEGERERKERTISLYHIENKKKNC